MDNNELFKTTNIRVNITDFILRSLFKSYVVSTLSPFYFNQPFYNKSTFRGRSLHTNESADEFPFPNILVHRSDIGGRDLKGVEETKL